MHLKTLTMKGFKSFASSTTLRLEPGITAVVGPNGSGKSNVVDALTWVMGEQGAKNLRGGSMADVIFAGAGNRPALGRAEVSLTIDNADGALPIDYTEVTITRTLFRGGGSEYRINGTPCRLLDVQELLSDTGLGRQMHSVVGQGRLDAVLSAAPEDLRGFIEEAAGVLKHRRRKERALRKLDSTAADLDRVSDLTAELRRQLGPLARQAAVARRAQTIQVEVRDATARLLADDVVQVQSLLAAGEEDKAALARRRTDLEESERVARARLAELAALEASSAQRLGLATGTWEDLTSAAQSLAALAEVAAERVRGLTSAHRPAQGTDPEELERRADVAAEQESELAAAVERARTALSDASRLRADAEAAEASSEATLAALQRRQAEHREKLARAGGRLASARSRHEAALVALDQARSDLAAAQARADHARAALAEVDDEPDGSPTARRTAGRDAEEPAAPRDGAASVASQAAAVTDEGQTLSDRETSALHHVHEPAPPRPGVHDQAHAAAAHEAATVALAAARKGVSAATDARREAASDRATWAARRDTLAMALAAQDATAELVGAGLPGVLGPLAESLTVQRGWENAVAALLGERAGAVLVADAETAVAALLHVRAVDAGAVHLLIAEPPVDGAPPAPDGDEPPVAGVRPAAALVSARTEELGRVLNHVLNAAWAAPDLETAYALRTARPEAVVATRNGEVLAPAWGSSAGRGASSVLELAAAHEEAAAEAEAATQAEVRADTALEEARVAEDAARRAVSDALVALRAADAHAARRAEVRARLASAAHAAREELGRARRVLERAEAELAQRVTELASARTALSEVEVPRDEGADAAGAGLDSALETARREREELVSAARRARSAETEARLSLRTAEERERSSRGRAASLRAAAHREREQRAAAERAERRRAASLATAAHVRDQAHVAAETARGWVVQAQEERTRIATERERAVAETGECRSRLDALGKELALLTDAVHREEIARAEQTMRLQALADRAMSELGLELESLVDGYGPHMPVPEIELQGERGAQPETRPGQADAESRSGRQGRETYGAGRPYVRAEQEKRLARATRDLARLGRINPLALEEHAALEQRHQFLAEQLADLKASRDDLLRIVAEIDERVQDVFSRAYQDTAREFEVVFDRLFPGGQGRLVLTEPDSMLTTGIEIEARPAGKKVKRLSLLSGGERSLAAVALLVAIFRARPSPFYVMDEVEAALDDTNLGRLLEIFTELRASSQLIIVTHQKRTMEVADALYGITMRDGVTMAVSQRLAGAAQ